MPDKTLRQLARAHSRGELSREEYREARAELLEGILSGDITLQENDYPSLVDSSATDDTLEEVTERKSQKKKADDFPELDYPLPEEVASAVSPPPRRPPAKSLKWPLVAGISGLILVVALLWLLWLSAPSGEDEVATAGTADQAASAQDTATPPAGTPISAEARQLISGFLKERSWSRESIQEFVSSWNNMSEAQRQSAQDSVALGRLGNAIYKQLLAEKALSGLDNGDQALQKQRQLVDFAREVGIDDPRISMPERNTEPKPSADGDGGDSTPIRNSQTSLSDCRPALLHSRASYCRDPITGSDTYGPTMVMIPPGEFTMGGQDQQPRHRVTIDYGFALSVHEITYGEFSRFCDMTGRTCPDQPWFGADYPVVNVTWHEARAYARWLTRQTGKPYRLPSEAEWEYAARAGLSAVDKQAPTTHDAVFSSGHGRNGPLPKSDRSVNRNRFQLYNMLGNVREWTADSWHGSYSGAPADGSAWLGGTGSFRVVRGGSYADTADTVGYAARERLPEDSADRYTGFRVVQEVDNS